MANYIRKTHEHWTTLPPRIKKKVYEGATSGEIAEIRKKTAMRLFPNYVGTMLSEFRDFSMESYRENWDLLMR